MTTVIRNIDELNQFKKQCTQQKIAFVPTMGNLHDGHLSLVHQAKKKADKVIVSIYVNPTQFGVNEDLSTYPRTLDKDLEKLKKIDTSVLFLPKETDIYPYGADNTLLIDMPKSLTHRLCGLSRPTHFQGVATVVAKLLRLVKPDIAIFGQKDYQQLAVINRLCEELFIDTTILSGEIVRENNGLAMSSRNQYLTKEQKQRAAHLYKVLQMTKMAIKSGKKIETALLDSIKIFNEMSISIEYFECCDKTTLASTQKSNNAILLLASQIGSARLIDNLEL